MDDVLRVEILETLSNFRELMGYVSFSQLTRL